MLKLLVNSCHLASDPFECNGMCPLSFCKTDNGMPFGVLVVVDYVVPNVDKLLDGLFRKSKVEEVFLSVAQAS
jgi:hypothetical protein